MKIIGTLLILSVIFTVGCGGDPGASYMKDKNYTKAAVAYTNAISDDIAKSDVINFYLNRAISYAKVGKIGAAWGSWKMANVLNSQILASNSGKKEINTKIASAASEIKSEARNAQANRQRQLAAQYEKQKPQIYQSGVKLQAARNYAGALNEFNKIPTYRDAPARIKFLQTQVAAYVNRLWQQGFGLFSAQSYARAIRVFDQILAINPAHNDARVYKKRAEAQLKALRRF
jgi:hypothetical protein